MKPQLLPTATIYILAASVSVIFSGCRKILQTPGPTNAITAADVFKDDNTTAAAVTGIFYTMFNGNAVASSSVMSGAESISKNAGLYSDELQSLSTANSQNQAFFTNNLRGNNIAQWTFLYRIIYQSNLVIQGVEDSGTALRYRDQWLGEALFTRAFSYYYLVSLFGDVPLVTSPDIRISNQAARGPRSAVYRLIKDDLSRSVALLGMAYRDANAQPTNSKIRPNRLAALALLSRVYLELEDWGNAELCANAVISSTTPKYFLVPPEETFLSTSAESIWTLAPGAPEFVREYSLYNNNIPATAPAGQLPLNYGVLVSMTPELSASFEAGDLRAVRWVKTFKNSSPGMTWYLPAKYKSNVNGIEQLVVLRLAEQMLIRAEARAELNKLTSAKADLDAVRLRAGLPPASIDNQQELLLAIAKERRVELFCEFGFRFFDLKRTGQIDAVLTHAQGSKGSVWNSYKQIWPIPAADIAANPNLTQAPGYPQ